MSAMSAPQTPTPHLSAHAADIADAVLLPGDPLRAQFIADNYLSDVVCYNRVRNMLGFTGMWNGIRVSVQGTGMGVPSISIYATELFRFYGVKTAIRIGSCGALQPEVNLGDVVIAMSSHATSSVNRRYFHDIDFAPTANYELLSAAVKAASDAGIASHVGPFLTSDSFYDENEKVFELVAKHGTLAVEMECSALYTIAARHSVRAVCMATVSDHLLRSEKMSSDERQTGFAKMVDVALATVAATR
jgi:purine-nucleoside phosphorylase